MKRYALHHLVIAFTTLLCVWQSNSVSAEDWQAGVARSNITPSEPMWMAGYASRSKPAEGKLHDLWAKALVIRDPSGRQQVLITLDLIGISRPLSESICRKLQKSHSLDRSQIVLSTSHTHTGPVVGRNLQTMYFVDDSQKQKISTYADFLEDGICNAVNDAIGKLEPSTLKLGLGKADFAVNRRNNREADVPMLRERNELKGPVHHAVPVLSISNAAGDQTALVFGYACHATTLSFYQWSGDWPGFAQLEVEKRHPGTIAMFVTGCGADQNPLPRRTVELAADYGRQTADAVDDALANEMKKVEGELKSDYKEVPLKLATLPTREELTESVESTNRYIASRAKHLLTKLETNGKLSQFYDAYPVQTWQIGNGSHIVFLGGEVVVDYAIRIPAEFPETNVWVAGYCNDVMAYIPSKRVLQEGGYEGETSMIYYGLPTKWDETVEETIVEEAGRQLAGLRMQ